MKRKRSSNGSSSDSAGAELQKRASSSPPNKAVKQSAKNSPLKHCLFCYKLVDNYQNDKVDGKIERIRRMGICLRFYSQVITEESNKIETGVKWKCLKRNCGVCDDCFYVVENYCKVYEEIEYQKLRLRLRLDKIQKVMKYAGKVPSRVKAFQESFNGWGASTGGGGDFDEVKGLRQKIFDGCVKRLKIKNPRVVLTPLRNNLPIDNGEGASCDIDEDEAISDDNHSQNVLEEPVERSTSREPSVDPDTAPCGIVTHETEDSSGDQDEDGEVLYILKMEGEPGKDQRFVTPPESILERIRSGDVPMEGVSGNHYFYCEQEPAPVSSTTIDNEEDSSVSKFGSGNSAMETVEDLMTVYKCIKCSLEVLSEAELIRHAKEGNCFTDENVDLTVSPPKTSVESVREVSSGNLVKKTLDKILSGLGSMSKCQNCSKTFSNEIKFKNHMSSRECFREVKPRSGAKVKGKKKRIEYFSSDDDDSSSMSESSHDDDSDYAPKLREVKNIKNKKGGKKTKEMEVVKASCPKPNCDKFFLYKEDMERHLKKHH